MVGTEAKLRWRKDVIGDNRLNVSFFF